jgi:cell division protein FtsQ
MAATLAILAYLTPVLDLRQVSVTLDASPHHGDQFLTQRHIKRTAAAPTGTPLARADLDAIRARLTALPRVASADVTREWPHTLRLHIKERRAVAVVRESGESGRYVEVDARGVRFGTSARPPRSVPQIRMSPTAPRSAAYSEAALVRAAVTVAGDLPSGVRDRAQWVQVDSYDDISIRIAGPDGKSVVNWGSPERGAQKAAALTALLKREDDAAVYNVTSPGSPALG